MIKLPSLDELVEAGVHLGHKKSRLAPKMLPYIYGVRNTSHLIDLEKTLVKLEEAMNFIADKVAQGGVILFLGTKPAAKKIIKKYAEEVAVPFVYERWLPGTLTNFETIVNLIEKFKKMEKEKAANGWEKYTKKERLNMEKTLISLEKMVGGIKSLTKKPDVLFIVDTQEEKTALKEAKRCNIPVVAMVNTNANPEKVDWAIPTNDNAVKVIELITKFMAEAVKEGKLQKEKNKVEVKEKKEIK